MAGDLGLRIFCFSCKNMNMESFLHVITLLFRLFIAVTGISLLYAEICQVKDNISTDDEASGFWILRTLGPFVFLLTRFPWICAGGFLLFEALFFPTAPHPSWPAVVLCILASPIALARLIFLKRTIFYITEPLAKLSGI